MYSEENNFFNSIVCVDTTKGKKSFKNQKMTQISWLAPMVVKNFFETIQILKTAFVSLALIEQKQLPYD